MRPALIDSAPSDGPTTCSWMIVAGAGSLPDLRTFARSSASSSVKSPVIDEEPENSEEYATQKLVLPDAEIKIYLTASAEARADRRYKELIEKGQEVNYDNILREIELRDYQDTHREIAPLKKADDAVLVDTTKLNLQESIDYMLNVIKERI